MRSDELFGKNHITKILYGGWCSHWNEGKPREIYSIIKDLIS